MNIFKQSLHFLGLIRERKIQCSTSVFLPFRLTLYAKTFGRFYRSPRRLTNKSKAHRNPTSSGNALNQYLTVNPLAWLSNWLRKVFLYNCKRRAGEKLMNLPGKVGGIPTNPRHKYHARLRNSPLSFELMRTKVLRAGWLLFRNHFPPATTQALALEKLLIKVPMRICLKFPKRCQDY